MQYNIYRAIFKYFDCLTFQKINAYCGTYICCGCYMNNGEFLCKNANNECPNCYVTYHLDHLGTVHDKDYCCMLLRFLLKLMVNSKKKIVKAYISAKLFEICSNNYWFLELHPKFRDTVIEKLDEFSNSYSYYEKNISSCFSFLKYPSILQQIKSVRAVCEDNRIKVYIIQ